MSQLLMIIDFFFKVKKCKLDLVLVSHVGGTSIWNLILVLGFENFGSN